MIIEKQEDVTPAVLAEMQRTPEARTKQILEALVRHLHGFVREVRLTEREFQEAVRQIARLGQLTTPSHNEVMLMSGALGVRHTYGPARGFIDLSFTPSPVPEQKGRSSYVDNDRAGLAVGADIKVPLGGSFVRPGFQLSAQRLIPRHNTKDASRLVDELPDGAVFDSTRDPVPGSAGLQTNNPGYPGFASAGYVWSGFFSLEIPL